MFAGVVFAGDARDDPISRLYSELAFGSFDEARFITGGPRHDSGMVSMPEPLLSLYDDRLFLITTHASTVPGSSTVRNRFWADD